MSILPVEVLERARDGLALAVRQRLALLLEVRQDILEDLVDLIAALLEKRAPQRLEEVREDLTVVDLLAGMVDRICGDRGDQ
jgi:hypothetical protein